MTFLMLLAISVGVNTLMQVAENVIKIVCDRLWAYPGILYLLLVLPLGVLLTTLGLMRWGKVKDWMAVLLAVAGFAGSMVVVILLTDVIGLTAPGS